MNTGRVWAPRVLPILLPSRWTMLVLGGQLRTSAQRTNRNGRSWTMCLSLRIRRLRTDFSGRVACVPVGVGEVIARDQGVGVVGAPSTRSRSVRVCSSSLIASSVRPATR